MENEIEEIEDTIESVAEELLATSTNYKIVKSGDYVEVYVAEDKITDEERKKLNQLLKEYKIEECD